MQSRIGVHEVGLLFLVVMWELLQSRKRVVGLCDHVGVVCGRGSGFGRQIIYVS